MPFQSADTSSPREDDALRLNCTAAAIEEFPKWPLDSFQRAKGGMALNFAIAIYLIMALGIICDDYFVPVLEMICDALKVSTCFFPSFNLHPVGGMGLEWSRGVAWVERPFQSKLKQSLSFVLSSSRKDPVEDGFFNDLSTPYTKHPSLRDSRTGTRWDGLPKALLYRLNHN